MAELRMENGMPKTTASVVPQSAIWIVISISAEVAVAIVKIRSEDRHVSPVAGIARSPCPDPGDIHWSAEIVPVFGCGEPTGLAGGFARGTTARCSAVSLVTPVTRVGGK